MQPILSDVAPVVRSAALAIVVVLSACSADAARAGSSTDEDLSSEIAVVQLARSHIGGWAEFIQADAGGIGAFEPPGGVVLPDWPRNHMVWAIDFRTVFVSSCPVVPNGQAPPDCRDRPATVRVVLDYWTGEYIYSAETSLQ